MNIYKWYVFILNEYNVNYGNVYKFVCVVIILIFFLYEVIN